MYTKKMLKKYLVYLAALLLGALLTFSFAPYHIFPLAILSLAGLIVLILDSTPKQSFFLGFAFGLGQFGLGVYWVYISIHFFGDVSIPLSLFITSGLIVAMSFFPATALYLSTRYFSQVPSAKILYAVPAFWVLFEWLRSWLFTGFPWLLLGYSQTVSPLKGFAPLLSVYGVSLAVAISSSLLVLAILKLNRKQYRDAYTHLLVLFIIWIGGGLLSLIPWTQTAGNPITVSLVQGNIPQSLKWSPEHLQLSLDRYQELSQPLWGKSQLIVWPEAAIPLPLKQAEAYLEEMHSKALSSGTQLLLGIPIQSQTETFYNAVISLGKQNTKEPQVYLKRHLVPFGEYTPLSYLISDLLKFMDIPMSDLIPGKYDQTPMIVDGKKILTAICYEIAFPELFKTQDKSLGFIVTLTNNAWFGKSAAQEQQLQMAAMRAIELGRPVLSVGNDGLTAIIGPKGTIDTQVSPYQPEVLTGVVQPTYGLTPWMKNGMDPILFILLCLILAAYRAKKIHQTIQYGLETS